MQVKAFMANTSLCDSISTGPFPCIYSVTIQLDASKNSIDLGGAGDATGTMTYSLSAWWAADVYR